MRDILLLPGHLGDCILAIQQGQLSHSPVQLQGHLKELGSLGSLKRAKMTFIRVKITDFSGLSAKITIFGRRQQKILTEVGF